MRKLGADMEFRKRIATRGYVLVEVIVSLVVFSIGMLSVMRTFSVTAQARGVAQDYTIANFLCQKLLSESRAMAVSEGEPQKSDFGKTYPRFSWERAVTVTELMAPQQEEEPEQGKSAGRRRKKSEPRKSKSKTRAERVPEKPPAFIETSVTVSWTRSGFTYSVSARRRIPEGAGERKDVGR